MPSPFFRRIRSSLANPILQAALEANAEKRAAVRRQAFSSLPDYESRRQRAHSVRADVISNLDRYLEKFIEKVEDNGIFVHHAPGQDEAVGIVLDIAAKNQARLIAKSKTMVSEEIHLNQALETAGLEVVETDLGEYIVQLRHEPPSHIITPAVHLRRQEVGQTFHEKLGIPLTEDIGIMTDAARSVLRQVFLKADLGISGVNFGVVDTGTLCLLTNEGNGRMVTTLPRIHIALMGIERLVPNLSDLALMISMLPRSATGQKMTVYTSLIHGPRRVGEGEGPLQRHLILVDNGRTGLRDSPLAEILYCIRCGACLNACPIFREIGGHSYVGIQDEGSPYSGPMGSIVSPGLFGQAAFGHLARASTLCGACRDACPVDIDLPRLLLRVRAGQTGKSAASRNQINDDKGNAPPGLRVGMRIYTWMAASKTRFRLTIQAGALLARLFSPVRPWMRLPAFTGWGYSKDFPKPNFKPFRTRWAEIKAENQPPRPEIGEQEPSGLPDSISPRPYGQDLHDRDTHSLVNQFTSELQALGGRVILCSPLNLPHKIIEYLKTHRIQEIQSWADAYLPGGLIDELRKEQIKILNEANPEVSAGLTGAYAAVAETGSILLAAGEGRALSASLLPEIHMAVLYARQIYSNLEQVFSDSGLGVKEDKSAAEILTAASAAAVISGPSRTADIEMTLTIGVHGPKEVIVFCIED